MGVERSAALECKLLAEESEERIQVGAFHGQEVLVVEVVPELLDQVPNVLASD